MLIMSLKQKVASTIQKKFLGYEIEVLTFSQAGEDLTIRNLFYQRLSRGEKGFYADIGAYHPYKGSNTYYLYRCGWRGINIDASPNSMELFNKLRPSDINLEIGVADKDDCIDFYYFGKNSTLNTFSKEYIKTLQTSQNVQKIIKVPTKKLSTIFDENLPKGIEIDFLNIDIEGFEDIALASNDWTKYRPKLIAAEIYGYSLEEILNSFVSKFLIERGYEFFNRIPLSISKVNTVFFINSEKKGELWQL